MIRFQRGSGRGLVSLPDFKSGAGCLNHPGWVRFPHVPATLIPAPAGMSPRQQVRAANLRKRYKQQGSYMLSRNIPPGCMLARRGTRPTAEFTAEVAGVASCQGWIAASYSTSYRGEVFHTTYGGAPRQELMVSDCSIFAIEFADQLLGWNGTIVRTWNGGDDRDKMAETGSDHHDIRFFDGTNGYLSGMYVTSNCGKTVSPVPGWRDGMIERFCFTGPDCGRGVGCGGHILRLAEEGFGAEDPQTPGPSMPFGSLLCSPNPFRGSAAVSFTAADQAAPVTLSLYDLSGRLVARLLDGAVAGAGVQSVEIDGSAPPAGLYALRLEQEGFKATGTCIRLP